MHSPFFTVIDDIPLSPSVERVHPVLQHAVRAGPAGALGEVPGRAGPGRRVRPPGAETALPRRLPGPL